jgi:GNAT superfamily N-acetyltransferase
MTTDYVSELNVSLVWVLDDVDGLLGVVVTKDMGDHLLLENLAVLPSAQGHGYGRILLDRAGQDALELGVAQVCLYTNAAMMENLEFYLRQGHVESGRSVLEGYPRDPFPGCPRWIRRACVPSLVTDRWALWRGCPPRSSVDRVSVIGRRLAASR